MAMNTGSYKLYTCNGKPGVVAEYDMRMDCQQVTTKSLGKDEITSVVVSPDEQTLVVGTNNGVVKMLDISKGGIEETQSMNVFSPVNGVKGAVTRLKFHPQNLSLFASSAVGCIKLLRLSV
jgi:WD40 repeat protein